MQTAYQIKAPRVILFEISEINLYKINAELQSKLKSEVEIINILGNATNEKQINSIFETYNVDFVFHTAAYKHVPIVEVNALEGVKNNIFSTKAICKAVFKNNIENFVLISTDKAVRPTNVMGASKRAAELILQAYAKKYENGKTIYSMVRFGNVLDSSGSVSLL